MASDAELSLRVQELQQQLHGLHRQLHADHGHSLPRSPAPGSPKLNGDIGQLELALRQTMSQVIPLPASIRVALHVTIRATVTVRTNSSCPPCVSFALPVHHECDTACIHG